MIKIMIQVRKSFDQVKDYVDESRKYCHTTD